MKESLRLLLPLLLFLHSANLIAETQGLIHVKGSDTMVVVAQAWAEAYEAVAPQVTISVGGRGSGTGINALLNGTVEIANASRRMETSELERARRLGMDPVRHVVGYDALAVFLNPNNPVRSLTLVQLSDIYGDAGKTRKWTDLGVEVPGCPRQEIVRVGRQNNSGTYVYFRNTVLQTGRDYDLGILDMLGSKDVVHLVEKTPCAIGYSGLAYATPQVKMVCISKGNDEPCVNPSVKSAVDETYPIARPLFMYTKSQPGGPIKAYLDWILSEAGQCILLRQGYAPVKPVTGPAP